MKLKEPEHMLSAYHQRVGNHLYIHKTQAQVTQHATTIYFATHSDDRGVHIAPTGYMTINHTGERDLDVRDMYEAQFGVKCAIASDCAGLLICPHTDKEVKVSRVVDNPVLWLDWEHGIAVKSYRLKYETPSSPPEFMQDQYNVGRNKMYYSFSNQKHYSAFKKHWLALQPEAKLRYEIMGQMQIGWPNGKVEELVLNHPEATTLEQLCDIAKGINGFDPDDFKRMCQVVMILKTYRIDSDAAKMLCADKYETTYFKVKP